MYLIDQLLQDHKIQMLKQNLCEKSKVISFLMFEAGIKTTRCVVCAGIRRWDATLMQFPVNRVRLSSVATP